MKANAFIAHDGSEMLCTFYGAFGVRNLPWICHSWDLTCVIDYENEIRKQISSSPIFMHTMYYTFGRWILAVPLCQRRKQGQFQ